MTKRELQALKKQLEHERAVLLRTISPKMDASPRTGDPEGGDVCDIASSDRERDLKLRLSERDRTKLREIEDALERIEDGDYGLCEQCGAKIPVGRLKIMPWTTECVACKSAAEKQRKLYGPSMEGPFNRSGGNDYAREAEE